METIKAFNVIPIDVFIKERTDRLLNEIESLEKQYLIELDEEEYIKYLISKYSLELLSIDYENVEISEPKKVKEKCQDQFTKEIIYLEKNNYNIKYLFKGSVEIFKIRPNNFTFNISEPYPEILINEKDSSVHLILQHDDYNPENFKKNKNSREEKTFTNIRKANNDAERWNSSLKEVVVKLFKKQKSKCLAENKFFEAINLKVNNGANSVFPVPVIKKKIIPQLPVLKNKEIISDPILTKEVYEDILKIIYAVGKSMEKKPSLYIGKNEEAIRDMFLLFLETRYEATTATGETFNKKGKTDILLKYAPENGNLFIAECKFWHGPKEFKKAISQLFDGYLTWRDSKAALIFFVKNNDFSNVLKTIKEEAPKHPYYISEESIRWESSFSYHFHVPNDKEKIVHFEIIAFHFDKL